MTVALPAIGFGGSLILRVAVIVVLIGLLIYAMKQPAPPRLVGYGCDGSSGPLYANEEDHFPVCTSVEAYKD